MIAMLRTLMAGLIPEVVLAGNALAVDVKPAEAPRGSADEILAEAVQLINQL